MEIFYLALLTPVFGGLLSTLFGEKMKFKVVSFFTFISVILSLIPCIHVLGSGEALTSEVSILNGIFGSLKFVIDPLAAFFIIVISIMSFLGTIYANGYMEHYLEKKMNVSSHCVFLTALISSMMTVVSIQNTIFFLIAWEIMSLSSFFLVIFEDNKKEVLNAGIKYLVYMHVSVVFIMITFAILSIKSGNYDFNSFAKILQDNASFANLVFILGFIGFGIKAGFVPFHNWLPEAHPAAPSHVSAVMSGVMIKTGIYGILRILSLIAIPSVGISYFTLIISVITALYGILYAITQFDMKKLLAYSSIENIGIIGIGMGVGMLGLAYNCTPAIILGFCGCILHILNHSIFKELMFFAAGSVYTKTHSRDMEQFGGLAKVMPRTAFLCLIGAVAICGLPPFNGFVSEFLIYFGMLKGLLINNLSILIIMVLSLAGLALVGTMAILCFTKLYSIAFLGEPRSEVAKTVSSDVGYSMVIPMAILAVMVLSIGLFPQAAINLITKPVALFAGNFELPSMLTIMQVISFCAFGVFSLVIILALFKKLANRKAEKHSTWGCGYDKPNNHIQYTASSYASPFLSMLTPLFKKVFDIKKPKDLFPKEAHFCLKIEDVEEAYIIKPFIKDIEKFFSIFERIQNGNIQQYILYGLIFLILALIAVVFLG